MTDSEGIPWRSPTLHVILAATLMGVMGVSLISPALPAVRDALGITESEASLILSAFTLPGIVLGPVMGMLADRYGRRPVLVPCLVVYGLSGGAVLFAQGLDMVLALRFVQGSAAAGLITLAITLVGDLFDGTQRNSIMGANGAVLSIGTAVYPLLGGLLSTIDWRAPFAIYLIGVPVGLFALKVLDEPDLEPGARGMAYLTEAARALPKLRAAALYGTAFFIFVILYGGILTTLPFLLDTEMGLTSVGIGLVLTVSSFATGGASIMNGRLAMRLENRTIIAAGLICDGLGMVGLWAAPGPVTAGLAILFFGAGMGLAMPSLDTAVSHLVPGQYRGGAMSLRTSMVRLGQTVGPPVFALMLPWLGHRGLLVSWGLAAILLGAAALALGALVSPDRSAAA